MDSDTKFIIICFAIIAVLIVIIILGTAHHVTKAKFKPKFVRLSDGSFQMEFGEFGGLQTTRTKRFLEEYKVGQEVIYQNQTYYIEEIKEVNDNNLLRNDVKMVCYLTERK